MSKRICLHLDNFTEYNVVTKKGNPARFTSVQLLLTIFGRCLDCGIIDISQSDVNDVSSLGCYCEYHGACFTGVESCCANTCVKGSSCVGFSCNDGFPKCAHGETCCSNNSTCVNGTDCLEQNCQDDADCGFFENCCEGKCSRICIGKDPQVDYGPSKKSCESDKDCTKKDYGYCCNGQCSNHSVCYTPLITTITVIVSLGVLIFLIATCVKLCCPQKRRILRETLLLQSEDITTEQALDSQLFPLLPPYQPDDYAPPEYEQHQTDINTSYYPQTIEVLLKENTAVPQTLPMMICTYPGVPPKIARLIYNWAPLIKLDKNEVWRPSGIEHFLSNTKLEGCGQKPEPYSLTRSNLERCNTNSYLTTKESLSCPSCTEPVFLRGQHPRNVPLNVIYRQHKNFLEVAYWTFFPYNRGKRVCFGYVQKGCFLLGRIWGRCPCGENLCCIGEYSTLGHHVGDWERITVRFRKVNSDYRIYSIHLSIHGIDVTNKFGGEFLWQ
ncbi:unnamed protein product, partial [Porites evermanni]